MIYKTCRKQYYYLKIKKVNLTSLVNSTSDYKSLTIKIYGVYDYYLVRIKTLDEISYLPNITAFRGT